MENNNIIKYNIYEEPQAPTENGKYYACTPILEQAENIVKKARERGQNLFIKVLYQNGTEKYYY